MVLVDGWNAFRAKFPAVGPLTDRRGLGGADALDRTQLLDSGKAQLLETAEMGQQTVADRIPAKPFSPPACSISGQQDQLDHVPCVVHGQLAEIDATRQTVPDEFDLVMARFLHTVHQGTNLASEQVVYH